MKLYIFTEEALRDGIMRAMENIDMTLGLCAICETSTIQSLVKDAVVEQAEKSGHIIDREDIGIEDGILGVLRRCFPRARKNPVVNEAVGQ